MTSTKEKILEEFQNKYSAFELCNQISKRELDKLKQFLSKAIDQTREETIKEVEEMLPDKEAFANGEFQAMACGRLLNNIKSSLKSLINKQ